MTDIADWKNRSSILVRGVGDVASAVAHRLHADGFAVALHQGGDPPLTHRRAMAFSDCWFDGACTLADLRAERRDAPEPIVHGPAILLFRCDLGDLIAVAAPAVLIDARMRKRATPERQRHLAPLTIGLGPGFEAGGNVDWAVETSWGDQLGCVLRQGATLPLAGEPRAIGTVGRERIVYAPRGGFWRTATRIGEAVAAGAIVAMLDEAPITAPIGGTVRGIVHGDVAVARGTKLLEIDPRPAVVAQVGGLGERPRRIAAGIAAALATAAFDISLRDRA